jgi:CheY-like chemotaxis protein
MGGPIRTSEVRQLRVLVVDDDPIIGAIFTRLLKPWSVVFAQSAAGALARIQAGGKFDAILCDVAIPGMSGMEFHQAVAEAAPSMARRIVFVTGGASTPEAVTFLERTTNTVLLKPVEGEILRRAVADASREAG